MNIFHLSSRELGLLIYLGQKNALDHIIEITTIEVATVFSISQQSASRSLLQLAEEGYIKWQSSPIGSKAKLTTKGIDTLHKLRFEIERAIHPDRSKLTIMGTIFTGLGEGSYYMSRPNYVEYFKKELGYIPYPGTLNIRVGHSDVNDLDLIRGSFPKIIPGFEEEGRKFGDVLCYPVEIFDSEVNAALIIPNRTHYGRNITEIVSDKNLRRKFDLEDGDQIVIHYKIKQESEK